MKSRYVNLLIIVVALLMSAFVYPKLRPSLTIHWLFFKPNLSAAKLFVVLFIPILMLFISYSISFLFDIDSFKKNVSEKIKGIIITSLLLSLLTIHMAILTIALGFNLNISMVSGFILGTITMILSNIMPKVERNRVFGLRTKWTIKDDRVWLISNRFISKLLFLSGFLMVISVMVTPNYSLYFAIFILLLVGLIGYIHSYITYKKLNFD